MLTQFLLPSLTVGFLQLRCRSNDASKTNHRTEPGRVGSSFKRVTATMVAPGFAVYGDAHQLRASRSVQRRGAFHGDRTASVEGGHRHCAVRVLLGLCVHADSRGLDRRSIRYEAGVFDWLSLLVFGRDPRSR